MSLSQKYFVCHEDTKSRSNEKLYFKLLCLCVFVAFFLPWSFENTSTRLLFNV